MGVYKLKSIKSEDGIGADEPLIQISKVTLPSVATNTVALATNLTVLEGAVVTGHTTQTSAYKVSEQPASGSVTITGPASVADKVTVVLIGRVRA